MAFFVRTIHVGSVSFILGGAILLLIVFYLHRTAPPASSEILVRLMQAYEYGFWAALGLIVATGVGNVAHFGEGLPGADSQWGRQFTLKLALVGVLLLVSCVRILALYLLSNASPQQRPASLSQIKGLYGGTAVLIIGAFGLAVSMAHF